MMKKQFTRVKANQVLSCLDEKPKTIETSLGIIEYGERGTGPVILSIHGGPGGYDQGLALSEVFHQAGFRVIAPSRAGYLGTPSDKGQTYEQQADMHAALLDALNIDKAIVVGASAGGPSSYTIAQRHPDKVKALIPIDCVSMEYTKLKEISKSQEFLYLSKPGIWFIDYLMKHFPSSMVTNFLKTESTLDQAEVKQRMDEIIDDDDKLAFVKLMMATMTKRYADRKEGLDTDIKILSAIDKIPVDKITCPTLIVHGTSDSDVGPNQAEYAHKSISDSEILWVNKGSHIGFWVAKDAYDVQAKTIDWLNKVLVN